MNKFIKYPALAVLLLLVAVVAAACDSGGGTSNTPEDAAKAWFDAAFAGNADGVRAQTCAAEQEGVETAITAFGAGGSSVDVSGLTFTKATEEGDRATVTLGGSIKVTAEGQEIEQPMEDITVPLIKEDNAWKVCETA